MNAVVTNEMFQRSSYAVKVAEALYRASRLDDDASLDDASPMERRDLLATAEAAVQMSANRDHRQVAVYCAAEAFTWEMGGISFHRMPVENRRRLVTTTQLVISRFMACLRGSWPADVPIYQALMQSDRDETRRRQAERKGA